MWFIYTMEYYIAEKNNDILNFAGNWIELENIILREVTQTQKDNFFGISILLLIFDTTHRVHGSKMASQKDPISHTCSAFPNSLYHLTYFFTILALCFHTLLSLSPIRAYSIFYCYCVKLQNDFTICCILNT